MTPNIWGAGQKMQSASEDDPADFLAVLQTRVHLLRTRPLAAANYGDDTPLLSLTGSFDLAALERLRDFADRRYPLEEDRTTIVSASHPNGPTIRLNIYDPAEFAASPDTFADGETGQLQFADPTYNGSELKFEFERPGRYLAELRIAASPDAKFRLSETKRLKGMAGRTKFSEYFAHRDNRAVFLFEAIDDPLYSLALSFFSLSGKPAFRWAKFTYLSGIPGFEGK
ncbi:hypothetical protein [Mesorhizobium jarvisii]|uniref:hypothetical protein n=1 Tax=Mesorhizobium jarvisii TaxID=1777867 RepID=UPI001F0AD89A|nr:hypothetical protein [Mesorhizobium jarvisii]MCH4560984.1 hypothetical protein [Mesorhizobium jarvisii]